MKDYEYSLPIICSKIYHHISNFYNKKFGVILFSVRKSKLTFFHQVINYILCWYVIFYMLPDVTINKLLANISFAKLDSIGIISLGIFLHFFISPIIPFFDRLISNIFEYIFKANLATNQVILIIVLSVIIGRQEINRINSVKTSK